jgi:hypothetical protein
VTPDNTITSVNGADCLEVSAEAAASERAHQVARLFDQAWFEGPIDLVTVSGLELCALGGLRQALFHTAAAEAWSRLDEPTRAKASELALAGLAERGLLLPIGPGRADPGRADPGRADPGRADPDPADPDQPREYHLSPETGIMLAARSRPAYVVTTEVMGSSVRCLQFFAVGDEEIPVRGVVIEEPTLPPPDSGAFPHRAELGALGWLSSYTLVSESTAAAILAQVAIAARPSAGEEAPPPAYVISRLRHLPGQSFTEAGMVVIGNGTTARVRPHGMPGTDPDVYDGVSIDELRALIQQLFISGT